MKKLPAVLILVSFSSDAEGLKDAFTRDDDLSGTTISVDVDVNNAGHYVYTYDVSAPSDNTGYLLIFTVDLSCATEVPTGDFDPDDYRSEYTSVLTEDIPHVPAAISAPYGEANAAFSALSEAFWGVGLAPGEQASGLKIISPYPPGDRVYALEPSGDYRWDEYNYETALESENRHEVPWIEDWTVTGLTQGPACPGAEYPDDDSGQPVFEGTLFRSDTPETNTLLTYSSPTVDQMRMEPGVSEVALTIHYAEEIDPKSFRVTPAHSGWQRLFDPAPGKTETVVLPLRPGKNRIALSVKSSREQADAVKEKAKQKQGAKKGVREDKDVFVFRVPEAASSSPRGKK